MEDGAVERRESQARIFGRAEAPADDPPRVAIHDDGQVPPGGGDRQIRDVADPDLIRDGGESIELAIGDASEEAVQPGKPPSRPPCASTMVRAMASPRPAAC
jgi:hypothetical protein